jgi:hypothetical protein
MRDSAKREQISALDQWQSMGVTAARFVSGWL